MLGQLGEGDVAVALGGKNGNPTADLPVHKRSRNERRKGVRNNKRIPKMYYHNNCDNDADSNCDVDRAMGEAIRHNSNERSTTEQAVALQPLPAQRECNADIVAAQLVPGEGIRRHPPDMKTTP